MKKQFGSAHIGIIIALVIALMGVLGFVFWQNFTQQYPGTDHNSTNSPESSTVDTADPIEETIELSEYGVITGTLTYPSEGIPPSIEVHATNIATGEGYSTNEHIRGSQFKTGVGYRLSVPAGNYYVYAIKASGSDQRAYYNNFVKCDFLLNGCEDSEKRIVVTVEPGKDTTDITAGDWYNPCLIQGGKQPTNKYDLPTC